MLPAFTPVSEISGLWLSEALPSGASEAADRLLLSQRRGLRYLADAVVGSLPIKERVDLVGETMLIVGSRAEESTFPYGFFKDWVLDKNTGHFARS